MSIILLIRHAENEYMTKGRLAGRLPNIHLNDNGRIQARQVAEKLSQLPIKAIYSSPLDRAMETAQPIADKLNLEVIPRQGLIETDYGEWQGKVGKRLSRLKIWQLVQHIPSAMRFPGGETFMDAQYRICREIELLCRNHDPQDMFVCVTHADPIKLAVAHYIGLPLDMFQRLTISPASITALFLGQGGNRLLTLNYSLSLNIPKM